MTNALRRFQDLLKSEFRQLKIREILPSKPSVLPGVSAQADDTLKKLKIETIVDLGMSNVFATARAINDLC